MALENIKNALQRGKALRLMAFLVAAATEVVPPATVPAGFAYVPEKDATLLAKAEPTFFNVDMATKDPSGNVKVIALQPAIDAQAAIVAAAATQKDAAPVTPAQFELEDGIGLPERKRGGSKADIYPFDKMTVGQSFFVAATTEKPNPAKSLASTVSSATKRYKADTPARKFTVRPRVVGDTSGMPAGKAETQNGARVWRSQ